MPENSLYTIIAVDDNQTIGMGRLIGDGMYYLIADIVVQPDYQNKGVGSKIVNMLIEYVDKATPVGGRSTIQLIANLLIEYIGYDYFQKTVNQVEPEYVSCIIQINVGDSWVSDSPYIHAFDDLEKVHHQMDENLLIQAMQNIGYEKIAQTEKLLPNGKKLVQLDFKLSWRTRYAGSYYQTWKSKFSME